MKGLSKLLMVLVLFFFSQIGYAATNTVEFKVTVNSSEIEGPMFGDFVTGFFSFDSSIIAVNPGESRAQPGESIFWTLTQDDVLDWYWVVPNVFEGVINSDNCSTCNFSFGRNGEFYPSVSLYSVNVSNSFFSISNGNNLKVIELATGNTMDLYAGPYNAELVPIPSAVWLFGSGVIGLIGFARRKA